MENLIHQMQEKGIEVEEKENHVYRPLSRLATSPFPSLHLDDTSSASESDDFAKLHRRLHASKRIIEDLSNQNNCFKKELNSAKSANMVRL